jgi:hypothetical protein
MATRTSTSIFFANDTDAHFRAWAQEIHDALTAFGWVNTTDTGQINLATVLHPTVVNTAQGYEIWRMNDSLQTSFPVYLKIEYGSGTLANSPAVWITLGTGSNGSGTLTGNLTTRQQSGGIGDTARANAYYSSGSSSRFAMAWGADAGATGQDRFLYLGIERLKNADGTDANDGAFWCKVGGDTTTGLFRSQVQLFSGSVPPQENNGILFPCNQTTLSLIFGGTSYTLPMYPQGFYPRNPAMNFIGYLNPDFTREVAVSLTVYGASHTYMPLGAATNNFAYGSAGSFNATVQGTAAPRAMMRYE